MMPMVNSTSRAHSRAGNPTLQTSLTSYLSFDGVVEFARMADEVRSYEEIKLAIAQALLARI